MVSTRRISLKGPRSLELILWSHHFGRTLIPEVVDWITWAELDTVVARQLSSIKIEGPSLRGTVERLDKAVSTAIAIHS
jgi:hypothetical protein